MEVVANTMNDQMEVVSNTMNDQMDVLANTMMVIILQFIHASNLLVVNLKLTQYYVSIRFQ